MEAIYIFWGEGICGFFWRCELYLCSIFWFGVIIGGLLRSCCFGVLVLVDHIGYLTWHGRVDVAFGILPFEGQAHI